MDDPLLSRLRCTGIESGISPGGGLYRLAIAKIAYTKVARRNKLKPVAIVVSSTSRLGSFSRANTFTVSSSVRIRSGLTLHFSPILTRDIGLRRPSGQ